jgi:hypothetical protein
MLRTIIEHNENHASWEPAYPLWYGEPSDPIFYFGDEVDLIPALIESGATVVTDRLPEYREEELNVDGTEDWYYVDVQKLLDSPITKDRYVLKAMCDVIKSLSKESKCPPNHIRVTFYKPLLLELR